MDRKKIIKRTAFFFLLSLMLMLAACPSAFLAAKKKSTKTTKTTDYTPAQVKSLKATAGENKAVLKWKKVANTSGYYIYLLDEETGNPTKVKTIKKGSLVSATLTKLKNNVKYTYVVSAYRTKNKKTYEGAVSAKVTVTPRLDAPKAPVLKVYANNDGKVTLSWNKISKASGVEIYQKNSEGKFEKIGTATGTNITIKGLENGKTYQFKARSFRRVGSDYGYSAFSNTVEGKPFAPSKDVSKDVCFFIWRFLLFRFRFSHGGVYTAMEGVGRSCLNRYDYRMIIA